MLSRITRKIVFKCIPNVWLNQMRMIGRHLINVCFVSDLMFSGDLIGCRVRDAMVEMLARDVVALIGKTSRIIWYIRRGGGFDKHLIIARPHQYDTFLHLDTPSNKLLGHTHIIWSGHS